MYKVNQTVRKMLRKRGYLVPGEELSWSEFKAEVEKGKTRKDLDFKAVRDLNVKGENGEAKTEQIWVFFATESKETLSKSVHRAMVGSN